MLAGLELVLKPNSARWIPEAMMEVRSELHGLSYKTSRVFSSNDRLNIIAMKSNNTLKVDCSLNKTGGYINVKGLILNA